jgi:hypothetical protein
MEGTPHLRAWADALEQRDRQFIDSYAAMRERILKDDAIPAKYKLLMAMITDAIAAHPDGVKALANEAVAELRSVQQRTAQAAAARRAAEQLHTARGHFQIAHGIRPSTAVRLAGLDAPIPFRLLRSSAHGRERAIRPGARSPRKPRGPTR